MQWYRAITWVRDDCHIVVVEVERETSFKVWLAGRAYSKVTEGGAYFRTFDEARKYLIDLAASEFVLAEKRLLVATESLRRAEALTEGDVR